MRAPSIIFNDRQNLDFERSKSRALPPKRIYIIPALRAFILLYNIDLLIYFVFNII